MLTMLAMLTVPTMSQDFTKPETITILMMSITPIVRTHGVRTQTMVENQTRMHHICQTCQMLQVYSISTRTA